MINKIKKRLDYWKIRLVCYQMNWNKKMRDKINMRVYLMNSLSEVKKNNKDRRKILMSFRKSIIKKKKNFNINKKI